jgi:hypothetical protein
MRALIVRKPRSRRISDRIAYAKLVAESLKDNPYFPTPVPALARSARGRPRVSGTGAASSRGKCLSQVQKPYGL